jgi:hypothetical protein
VAIATLLPTNITRVRIWIIASLPGAG